MHCLVSYDIADNKRRLKTSKILDDYGKRVQRSVFELAELKDKIWQDCQERLKKIELDDEDSIRIYTICEACRGKIIMLGNGPKPMDEPDVYII